MARRGPLPTLDVVLGGDATRIIEFLRRVGRTDPPIDAATADPLRGGPSDVKEKKKKRLPVEPLALHQRRPPWAVERTPAHFVVELPTPTRRTDPPPPAERREAALRAIDLLPPADVTIWSDGSAREGTTCGGAGALIQLHCLGREERIRAHAGAVCTSLRAELTAIREALTVVTSLPDEDLRHVRAVRLLTDSKSGLQQLQRGPAGQVTALAVDI